VKKWSEAVQVASSFRQISDDLEELCANGDSGRWANEVDLVVRQAVREDIPGMHRVRLAVRENRLTSTVIRAEDYVREIEVTGRGWVITEEGNVVAFAVGNRETQNIWALFVDPEREGRGYGRRLHEVMVEWLFSQGVPFIWLSTDPGTRAQRFYEAAGWSFCRVLPDGEHYYELHRSKE